MYERRSTQIQVLQNEHFTIMDFLYSIYTETEEGNGKQGMKQKTGKRKFGYGSMGWGMLY